MRRSPGAAVLVLALLATAGCADTSPEAVPASSPTRVVTLDEAPSPSPSPTPSPTPSATPTARTAPVEPRVAGTVVTGLTAPWGLAFLPDGSALVSERDSARVLLVTENDVVPVGTVPGVGFGGEGGLLGVAVSPTFRKDRWVYTYFTGDGENVVVRMRLDGTRLGGPERVLDGIPAASIHNGGQIAFGPDGMLYVTTGDASDPASSQDPTSLAGKILRITPNGRVPEDNPDPRSPVWSSGHRNVQGIAWDDAGNLWASEFGWNTWDELNLIEAGSNYGWPEVEGPGGAGSGFVDPVASWPTDQASPSGVAYADGSVFVASLRGQRLWAVPVDGSRAGEPRAFFEGELGRLRAVAAAPNGSLWLVTNNTDGRGNPRDGDDRIMRLRLR